MPAPVRPVAPPQALRSNPDTFSNNAELAIQYQWTALPNWIEESAQFIEEQADAATAAALTGDVAPDISKALNYLRLNAAGEALEYRTPAQVLLDTGVNMAAGEINDRFALKAIGEPFAIWDHITGCPVPINSGAQKFIRLTAGLTGSGGYNEGLLGSESVSGSSPLILATATILAGPMTGQTVRLINTEGRFLRAGVTSGVIQDSQNLSHSHPLPEGRDSNQIDNGGQFLLRGWTNTGGSPTASGFGGGAAGGNEARPRNGSATYYLRIS